MYLIKTLSLPVPQAIQVEAKQQLDMMIEAGITERSIFEWACPMVMVKKAASSPTENLNSEWLLIYD